MNNNGDGKIPMIGQEKRDKWKKILPELLAVIVPGIDGCGSQPEGRLSHGRTSEL